MARQTNIWDGVMHQNLYLSGTTMYSSSDVAYALISLIPGHTYEIDLLVAADRWRCATFSVVPVANTGGVRSLADNDSPSAGLTFSFTAAANEYYLVCYTGHPSSGANNAKIGAYDMSVPDCTVKYLIRAGSLIYTVKDGVRSALPDSTVTASLFQNNGLDEMPDGSLLVDLVDPEVLYWIDTDTFDLPLLSMNITGVPPTPQVLISDTKDMSHETILGISSVTATVSADVLLAVTFDDGATWKKRDGTQWVDTTSETDGMTAAVLNAVTSAAWAEIATSTAYKFRFVLPNETSYITSVVVDYLN